MALTRKEKESLRQRYIELNNGTKNLILLNQYGIPVNEVNKLRMSVADAGGDMKVVKKKMFLNTMNEQGYEESSVGNIYGSLVALYSYEDEFAPLKAVEKYKKAWAKEGQEYGVQYLGGWFDYARKEGEYVQEIASLPSKEDLVGKFAFLLKYPMQSFAYALDQMSKQ